MDIRYRFVTLTALPVRNMFLIGGSLWVDFLSRGLRSDHYFGGRTLNSTRELHSDVRPCSARMENPLQNFSISFSLL
jgi:hypothetical protein